jgi:hypothetical protein
MKRIIHLIAFLSFIQNCAGQHKIEELTKPIVDEGKQLYKSEMASWYGTDIFLEKFKEREKIGGYLSYTDKDSAKYIFFSKGDMPKVIGTMSFDDTYNIESAKTDLTEREFTKTEFDFFTIRSKALKAISSDTFFKSYKNTNFNLVPLITNGEKKVYVLTGTGQTGVVIFGNDYLLTFDSDNNLTGRKQLHRNMIVVKYGEKKEDGNEIVGAIHTHLPETGDFMTATDICTLMLYEKFAKWKQHTVVSANYISIWNCETDVLIAITKDAMNKIEKDQKKRHKKE